MDYKLISICHRGDIVVSQDYGVAAMALSKSAYAIHQSGRWYTDENIDRLEKMQIFVDEAHIRIISGDRKAHRAR